MSLARAWRREWLERVWGLLSVEQQWALRFAVEAEGGGLPRRRGEPMRLSAARVTERTRAVLELVEGRWLTPLGCELHWVGRRAV